MQKKPKYVYNEITQAKQDMLLQAYYEFIEIENFSELEQNAILQYIRYLINNKKT